MLQHGDQRFIRTVKPLGSGGKFGRESYGGSALSGETASRHSRIRSGDPRVVVWLTSKLCTEERRIWLWSLGLYENWTATCGDPTSSPPVKHPRSTTSTNLRSDQFLGPGPDPYIPAPFTTHSGLVLRLATHRFPFPMILAPICSLPTFYWENTLEAMVADEVQPPFK